MNVPSEPTLAGPPAPVEPEHRSGADDGAVEAALTLPEALARMADAEDTLRAIGAGEIDAFVLADGNGRRIVTLSTADRSYRMFVENMHDGAATLAPSGIILYANRRLAALLSSPHDTIVGAPFARFIAADSPVGWEQLHAAETGSAGFEVNLVDANGVVVPVLVGTSALDMNGDRLACLTLADLSVQKAQDWELARLGRAEIDRMADLQSTQAALTEASERSRDEALSQSEMKSRFLATMSHEIRTPMNGVIGLSALLLGTDLDATQSGYAAGIHTAGKALLGVINDVLDFSKMAADKLVLDIDDFDMSAVLLEVTALVSPAAQLKGLTMVTRGDPKLPPTLRGDSGRLRQILLNLVGNAVKFTARGSVTLRVILHGTVPGDADAVMARIEVSDTGIGIVQSDAERLFEPYSQADASTTRAYGGTGLGLAISRQLTEAMGGTIGVDSAPGQGSTFWCLIPFGLSSQHHAPGHEGSSVTEAPPLGVLVVDAGPAQTQLQVSLRQWMMTSTATDNGVDAISALRQATERGWPFDVVIIDADLYGIEAVELAHQIADDPDIGSVRVIVLNRETPDDDEPAADRDITYLRGPFRESDLYESLARTVPGPPPAPPPTRSRPARATPPSAPGQRRILLVEDNDINQMVAVGVLTGLGYHLTTANDGIEAVALAAANTYDAILMDCQMPRMDGFSTTIEIRRREGEHRHTPIVAMTASALVSDREACFAAGMDDYLSKPIDPEELTATLNRWIPGPVAGHAPGSGATAPGRPAAGREVHGPPHEILDLDAFAELRDMGPSFLNRLVPSYVRDAHDAVAQITAASARADVTELARLAHRLRGSSGALGGQRLAATCTELEEAVGVLDAERITTLTATTIEQTEQFCEALQTALRTPASRHPGGDA